MKQQAKACCLSQASSMPQYTTVHGATLPFAADAGIAWLKAKRCYLDDGGQHALCIVGAQRAVDVRQAVRVGPRQYAEPNVDLRHDKVGCDNLDQATIPSCHRIAC